jgi:hypothetical protein
VMVKLLIGLGIVVAPVVVGLLWMTRNGAAVTPQGSGTVTTASGTYEAFPA